MSYAKRRSNIQLRICFAVSYFSCHNFAACIFGSLVDEESMNTKLFSNSALASTMLGALFLFTPRHTDVSEYNNGSMVDSKWRYGRCGWRNLIVNLGSSSLTLTPRVNLSNTSSGLTITQGKCIAQFCERNQITVYLTRPVSSDSRFTNA